MAHELVSPCREQGGWDVPKWPEKFGGPGWTPTQHYIWEQETAQAQTPWDLALWFVDVGTGADELRKEEQQKFLPDIRDRKVNWCRLFRAQCWIGLANLKTKAELSAEAVTM